MTSNVAIYCENYLSKKFGIDLFSFHFYAKLQFKILISACLITSTISQKNESAI